VTDEAKRLALLEQLAALSAQPDAIRRRFASATASKLATYIAQTERGKQAKAAAGGSVIGMHFQASRLTPAP
jgi:hypothetical protein